MPGWTVRASGEGLTTESVVTDDRGHFMLPLPRGGVWTPRFSLKRAGRELHHSPLVEQFEVAPGRVAQLMIELPSSSLAVRVVDEQGRPAPSMDLSFIPVGGSGEFHEETRLLVKTDDQGFARHQWLHPGTWVVRIYGGQVLSPLDGKPFELNEGQALVLPDIVLQRGCTVTGQAWGAPGVRLGDDVEVLFLGDDGQRHSTTLGRDESFRMTSLPPGSWQVVLASRSNRGELIHVPAGVGQRLNLTSGQEVEIELVMLPVR
ncbi:MAG: hypothetical protein ACI9EF_002222 [Pseudohongiellaceae bacterium]|jgi:hypothetical protein